LTMGEKLETTSREGGKRENSIVNQYKLRINPDLNFDRCTWIPHRRRDNEGVRGGGKRFLGGAKGALYGRSPTIVAIRAKERKRGREEKETSLREVADHGLPGTKRDEKTYRGKRDADRKPRQKKSHCPSPTRGKGGEKGEINTTSHEKAKEEEWKSLLKPLGSAESYYATLRAMKVEKGRGREENINKKGYRLERSD